MGKFRSTSNFSLDRRIYLQVVAPVAALAVAIAVLAALGLQSAIKRSDEASAARQSQEARLAIRSALDELAKGQTGVAIWDPAVLELRKQQPDLDWLDQNVGTWLNYVSGHDADYILGADDRPAYAMIEGVRAPATSYNRISAGVLPLIQSVRGRASTPANPHERLPAQPLAENSSAATSSSVFHATDLVSLAGRPAAVSVMTIVPDSYAPASPPGEEPLLVSVRYLDSNLMKELAELRLISGARITKTAGDASIGELSIPLVSYRGSNLGFFTWRPDYPGREILRSTAPITIAAVLGIALLLLLLVLRVARLMRSDASFLEKLKKAHLELKAKEAQAHHLAYHDQLTNLPNRASFNNSVDQCLTHRAQNVPFAVLLLDLDRFKQVNDAMGHMGGDLLIQLVAKRLRSCIEGLDIVARLGGDEFAVLLVDCRSRDRIIAVAERMISGLREPFDVMGTQMFIGVSIGIATSEMSDDRSDLLRKADIAMYRVKEAGRNSYLFFSQVMDESVRLRQSLEQDLRASLQSGRGLAVHYQAQLDSSGRQITGLEALLRWQHPTKGNLSPEAFIPIAEESGIISELGEWVLEEACRVARRWPQLSIAVNISPLQFRARDFSRTVERIVGTAGVDPRQIELEVTEGVLMDDDDEVRGALARLRKRGFRIALDDFGTGYSSLSYLNSFEVDKIKIDRSFIKRLGFETEATAIVQAVVSLGHAMALSVSAEGVETSHQHDLLRVAGCNELQGFFFSEAVPEAALPQLMAGKFGAAST